MDPIGDSGRAALELSAADRTLIEQASDLIGTHGDGDRHTVAAAVRSDGGRIVAGLNVYHFTGGPCAELVVLGRAAAEGLRKLEVIVAVADHGRGILAPCGRCRQILLDYQPTIRVIVSSGGSVRVVPIAELLPWANPWSSETGSLPG